MLRLREVKWLAQGHRDYKLQSWDPNPSPYQKPGTRVKCRFISQTLWRFHSILAHSFNKGDGPLFSTVFPSFQEKLWKDSFLKKNDWVQIISGIVPLKLMKSLRSKITWILIPALSTHWVTSPNFLESHSPYSPWGIADDTTGPC